MDQAMSPAPAYLDLTWDISDLLAIYSDRDWLLAVDDLGYFCKCVSVDREVDACSGSVSAIDRIHAESQLT